VKVALRKRDISKYLGPKRPHAEEDDRKWESLRKLEKKNLRERRPPSKTPSKMQGSPKKAQLQAAQLRKKDHQKKISPNEGLERTSKSSTQGTVGKQVVLEKEKN